MEDLNSRNLSKIQKQEAPKDPYASKALKNTLDNSGSTYVPKAS